MAKKKVKVSGKKPAKVPARRGRKPKPAPKSNVALAKRIEFKSPKALKPYKNNAKVHSLHQIELIAESIKKFGFNSPILIEADGTVIAGHGRLAAALHLKMENVPVVVIEHLSDDERRAYIIADNKLSEVGAEWDQSFLRRELADLDLNDFDLDVLGFSDSELEDLLPDLEGDADEILARNPEEQSEPDAEAEAEGSPAEPAPADEAEHDDGETDDGGAPKKETEVQEIDVERIPSGVSSETPDKLRAVIEAFDKMVHAHGVGHVADGMDCETCAFIASFESWRKEQ